MDCCKKIINGEDFIMQVSFFENDVEIGVPEYDFDIEFYCYPETKFVASKKGDVFTNCYVDDGKLIITFDHPHFGEGKLYRKAMMHIPDDRFEDGFRNQIYMQFVGVVI